MSLAGLTYVVVHEIIGDTAALSLCGWPAADPRGRVRFDVEKDPTHVAVNVHHLCEFLGLRGLHFVPPHDIPGDEKQRELRIGTTFAIEVKRRGKRWTRPLDQWIARIYDITRDARYVAKLSYYGALTEKWDHRKARMLRLTERWDLET